MRRSESYNCTGALVVGLLMIIIGVVLFFTQIPQFTEYVGLGNSGVGFWMGLYFVLLGSLQIGSSRNKGHCLIISVMVLAILGYFVAAGGAITAGIIYAIAAPSGGMNNDGTAFNYKLHEGICLSQMAFCIAENFLCIAAAVLCCRGVCSCCGASSQERPVVYNKGDAEGQMQAITSKY